MASPFAEEKLAPNKSLRKGASLSLHTLGVVCGLTGGVWMGAAEAPTKFVTAGITPFLISLGMVGGVFVARWTLPTLLKGTAYVFYDLREKPHLIVWALLAGALWAVANSLSIFGVRDVGLAIAFPLWNTDSLVGLLWGWLFFGELRGAGPSVKTKVLGGSLTIVAGAVLLGWATSLHTGYEAHRSMNGIIASLGASVIWGTMFLPYRKAYISGMNPLSFVTIFTFGELFTMGSLALVFHGGMDPLIRDIVAARKAFFWLFLGGFCWVVGDLFANYSAKYVGIGRAAPLMNTNQLWGLAWGVLVFGEFVGQSSMAQALTIGGSLIVIAGAVAISSAVAPEGEEESRRLATRRECERYGLNLERVEAAVAGTDPLTDEAPGRRWWDTVIVIVALGIFVFLATVTERPPFAWDHRWAAGLFIAMLAALLGGGYLLWKRTRFS